MANREAAGQAVTAEKKPNSDATLLQTIAGGRNLTPKNAEFRRRGDFPSLRLLENGESIEYPRVLLFRAFPFDFPDRYISVADEEEKEIGMINALSDFDEGTAALLLEELERRYYTPRILKVYDRKEKIGFSYWRVLTDRGETTFTMRDTLRNLFLIGKSRVVLTDVDGSRFEIEDVTALDKASYRRIEELL